MAEEKVLLPNTLTQYYERIGAEILNFRRGIVKSHSGQYYTERCLIKVSVDGTVKATHEEFDPTEDEARMIKAQWPSINFPRCVEAEEAGARRKAEELLCEVEDSDVHAFYSRATGRVVMLQHRFTNSKNQRQFVPHTLWSDGVWRKMEPEERLPLWKPKKARLARIMVHEGSKAAIAAESISIDPKSTHPWREYLSRFEHWGMIGGALAPHRTDWRELSREKPEEVIYVCDNDEPGKEALQKVSRHYRHSLKGITFDNKWPVSWDLADPIPGKFYHRDRYNGPMLEDMLKPATFATESVQSGGKGRPQLAVTTEFAREWLHSVTPEAYVHRSWPDQVKSKNEFNNLVAPFSDSPDTASKLIKHDASKGVRLTYAPGLVSGIYNDTLGGGLILNTHVPSKVRSREGDPAPFLEFIDHLVPSDEDRRSLLQWIVTLVAKPEIKMLYGVLAISEKQGVGKGTLGEKILAPLVGIHNTSFPTEVEIVESKFNYWAGHKRLAVVHEIYAGHSSKAYNSLKSLITDGTITIDQKYMAPYTVDNWLHVFACSNSKGALKLSQDDRRWFVPRITNKSKDPAWWGSFNEWLTVQGGLGIIRGWCDEQAKDPNMIIMKGNSAPMNETKKEVIQEGYSEGMRLVFDVLSFLKEKADEEDKNIIVLDVDLVRMSKEIVHQGKANGHLEKAATMRKVAQTVGWSVSDERLRVSSWGGRIVLGARPLLIGPEAEKIASGSQINLLNSGRPIDVVKFARESGIVQF